MPRNQYTISQDPEIHDKAAALSEDELDSYSRLIEKLLRQYIQEAEANGWVYESEAKG